MESKSNYLGERQMNDHVPTSGVRQVVAHTWREGVTDRQRDAFHLAVLSFSGIPEVRCLSAGHDLALHGDTWDYVYVIDFADVDSAVRYAEHPLHQAFVTDHAIPLMDRRAVVQYDLAGRSASAR
jgi:hypothetical protein